MPRRLDEINIFKDACTNTTAATASYDTLTTDKVKAMIEVFKSTCPFRKIMLENGFNPDNGDIMILPLSLQSQIRYHPGYVKFSYLATTVLLMKNPNISYELQPIDWESLCPED